MKFFLKRRILTGRLNNFIVVKLNLIDLEKFLMYLKEELMLLMISV